MDVGSIDSYSYFAAIARLKENSALGYHATQVIAKL